VNLKKTEQNGLVCRWQCCLVFDRYLVRIWAEASDILPDASCGAPQSPKATTGIIIDENKTASKSFLRIFYPSPNYSMLCSPSYW
jgi:hypothetical protein